ncbi:unnamed protein product, partial [Anisakis simplex]|uniref:F-box domain-containing protein n=1 Tax=Anisakis simplex TaxID=6269 RepID=A0A0M3J807_ANISI
DASVSDSTKTTLSTANERRRGLVDSGFVPPENDGHGSPEPDPERVLRQLRVPSNVELFYRTPNPFRYGLRMRLNDEGGKDYFETLPVDIILMIFSYLNKTDLVMAAMCCRRFRDIGYNQSLWEFMDLGQKFVTDTEIHSLMDRGVRYLRLTYTTIIAKQNDSVNSSPDSQPTHSSPTEEPQQPRVFPSKLTHLDLSGSAIERPDIFASILRRCTKLEVGIVHMNFNLDSEFLIYQI